MIRPTCPSRSQTLFRPILASFVIAVLGCESPETGTVDLAKSKAAAEAAGVAKGTTAEESKVTSSRKGSASKPEGRGASRGN
jgi:hypothetical protein